MALKGIPNSALTRREREVAALVAEGLTNREIAHRLFISERTADGHLEHIREKLGVNSRAQVAAWVVGPEGARAAPVPEWIDARAQPADSIFVGRDREMRRGLADLEEALSGRGRILLLSGEAGIGKSRLVDELAARAKERGVQVAWGRCWEAGGAPAYWPWVQSLRALVRYLNADALQQMMGSGVAEMAQLLPEINAILSEVPGLATSDPDTARFKLFDSATTFLKNLAVSRPIVLVLEDLQVADTPSLLLLRFVADALAEDRILLLGTFRDAELKSDLPLSGTLLELSRNQSVHRLQLRGLTETDVSSFIEARAGVTPGTSTVRAVHEQTDGNPLYLGEVVNLLLDEGRLEGDGEPGPRVGTPLSVKDVIGRRLEHLPAESLDVLTLASVFGREFHLGALSHLVGRSYDDILESLEAPLSAGVVADIPGAPGRMRFSHVVMRESLYDEISRARRTQLHRRAADVLEELYADDPDPHLAEVAHHFYEGAPGGDVVKAISFTRRAGDTAVSVLAYEEAVRLYRMTLQVLDLSASKDPGVRCQVLLALGDAQARAGDQTGSRETFLKAADLARTLSANEQLASAALGYGGRLVWVRAGADPRLVPLLRDGLNAVGEGDSVLRARILARLGGALRGDSSREPRESLSREAVGLARRLGDPSTLAYALDGLFAALWRPDNPQERLTIANEIAAVGEGAGDRERVAAGRIYRLIVFFETGDFLSAHGEMHMIERILDELRQPAHAWWKLMHDALLALLEGRLGDAEELVPAALRVGERANRSDVVVTNSMHLFQLRREQGRLGEVEEQIRKSAGEFTWYPMLRCALALLYCELGRDTRARNEFESIAVEDFAGLPLDNEWLLGMSLISEVAYMLSDGPRARILYEKLLPYAEGNGFGAADGFTGSMHRYLGLLATTMSRFREAAHHFEQGIERNQQMAARPWVARTQDDFATMLCRRGSPGDVDRAIELLGQALGTCEELGLSGIHSKVVNELIQLGVSDYRRSPMVGDIDAGRHDENLRG